MATQITKSEVIETIAQLINCKADEIKNVDMQAETFEKGKGVYMFALTPKKTMIKANSVRYMWSVLDQQNCCN